MELKDLVNKIISIGFCEPKNLETRIYNENTTEYVYKYINNSGTFFSYRFRIMEKVKFNGDMNSTVFRLMKDVKDKNQFTVQKGTECLSSTYDFNIINDILEKEFKSELRNAEIDKIINK